MVVMLAVQHLSRRGCIEAQLACHMPTQFPWPSVDQTKRSMWREREIVLYLCSTAVTQTIAASGAKQSALHSSRTKW